MAKMPVSVCSNNVLNLLYVYGQQWRGQKIRRFNELFGSAQKAYHVIDREEMERVTGTEHHGDMCLLVKKTASFVLEGYLQVPKKQDCLVLLDGVNNAQNVGESSERVLLWCERHYY